VAGSLPRLVGRGLRFTPIACAAFGGTAPLILQGKVRALAIASKKRLEALPDVPTLDELGIKDQEAETMTGVFVPAGTPKRIIDLLQNREMEAGDRDRQDR
jgi:tripartite-type tricarboxylate transporter receptor subunit TctC